MRNLNPLFKKVGIGLGIVLALYLLVLMIAGIYINSKKDRILQRVTAQLEEKLRGNVHIGNLDVSVWRHFPAIGFHLEDVVLADSVYNQPLISIKSLATTFNIFRLVSDNKKIKNLIIEDAVFHLFTDSSGYSNNYLLQPKTDKPGKVKKDDDDNTIEIEDVTIQNLDLSIEDKRANKIISMVVNELQASIHPGGKGMKIEMDEKITMKKGLGFNLDKGAYLEKQVLEGSWQLAFDKATKTLSFDKDMININQHPFELSGGFTFSETDPSFIIHVNTKDLPFDNAKAIVTATIRQKLDLVQMKTPLSVIADIRGSLLPNREPTINIEWVTEKNTLTTPVATFSDCNFTGNFINHVNKDSANGDPNSRISFATFNGNWGGVSMQGKNITITNLLLPVIHFDLYSDCALQALDDKFALKDIRFIDGQASLRLFFDGPVTKDMSMLQDLEGELHIKNGSVQYVPRNFTFTNCNGDVAFYQDSISLRKFSCNYLKNNLDVSVEGKNIRRKFIANDLSQEATIKCYVHSSYLNLEDFKPLLADTKQRTQSRQPTAGFKAMATKLDGVLENSVIEVDAHAESVKYAHLEAKDFLANIKFLPRRWDVAKVSINMAGGSIVTYGQLVRGANHHDASLAVKVDKVDIKKLLYGFDNFGQDAITSQYIEGSFSTTTNIKAAISNQGKVMPASIFGSMDFSLRNGRFVNFPPLANINTIVFKNRDLTDVRFAEIKDKIEMRGPIAYLNRMEIQSSVMRLFIEGNYGFYGKNTDLLVQIPWSNLNSSSFENGKAPKNQGAKKASRTGVWLRAENDDDGKVSVKLTLNRNLKDAKSN